MPQFNKSPLINQVNVYKTTELKGASYIVQISFYKVYQFLISH